MIREFELTSQLPTRIIYDITVRKRYIIFLHNQKTSGLFLIKGGYYSSILMTKIFHPEEVLSETIHQSRLLILREVQFCQNKYCHAQNMALFPPSGLGYSES